MQDFLEENSIRLDGLPTEEQRSFVDFFALLIKVDKRINPALYQSDKI